MQQWDAKWLMEINLEQCEVVRVANKMSHINYLYNTHDKELAMYNMLNIQDFNNNFRWNKHIDNIAKKAKPTCAFLSRNINSCLRNINAQCFTALVIPKI